MISRIGGFFFSIGINYSDHWLRREFAEVFKLTYGPGNQILGMCESNTSLSYHITKTKDSPAAT